MADPVTQIETAPLFKGATRPACILGVPTETFVITVLTGMVISLLFWPPLMLLIPIPVWIFKRITDRDDQVLYQWGIYFRTMIEDLIISNGSRIEMIRSSINGESTLEP